MASIAFSGARPGSLDSVSPRALNLMCGRAVVPNAPIEDDPQRNTRMRRSYYEPSPYYEFSTRPAFKAVVPWLIISCVAIFLLQKLPGLKQTAGRFMTTHLALQPLPLLNWRIWQYLTYMFLHGGLLHLLINMLFLYWFGREIETIFGARRFLTFYLTAGVIGGAAHKLFAVANMLPHPVLGASGAVLAVLVAFAVFFPDSRILFLFIFPMKMKHFVLLLVALDLFAVITLTQNGIASMAHLGGAAYGFIYVKYGAGIREALGNWGSRYLPTSETRRARTRARLQFILDKTRTGGLDSLTPREVQFLRKLRGKSREENRP